MRMRFPFALMCCFVGGPNAVNAQRVVALRAPLAVSTETFTFIAGALPLPSGSVIVADPREARLVQVDAQLKNARNLVKRGSGPLEALSIGRVFSVTADSLLMDDFLQRRFLYLTRSGVARAVPCPAGYPGRGDGTILGADYQGNLYTKERVAYQEGTRMTSAADSVAVLRVSRRNWRAVPVASVGLARERRVVTMKSRDSVGTVIMTRPPFSTGDQFTVMADGGFVLVGNSPFSIRFCNAIGRCATPVLPAINMPAVSARERAAYRRRFPKLAANESDWPARVPVMEDIGPLSVIARPGGGVLVRMSPTADQPAPRYVYISPSGVWSIVTLAEGARVVGASAGLLCVAQRDADDLETLQVFSWPV